MAKQETNSAPNAPSKTPEPGVTPAMAQFMGLKEAHPGYLLFYRMGDFYELFFEDAQIASSALGITLTKRGKHKGEDIPMCGVPVHAADNYLERLIKKGHKVAVCEQMEDPAAAKARGSKAVVHRDVVRLVTPGTLTEDTLLDGRTHNYLAALASAGKVSELDGEVALSLAWLDISTGEFFVMATTQEALGAELARLSPAELLVLDRLFELPMVDFVLKGQDIPLTPMPAGRFDAHSGEARLTALFDVSTLEGFGSFSRADLAAAGALIDYVETTQKGVLPIIRPPRIEGVSGQMVIDAATRSNLELIKTLSGSRKDSLLDRLDRTLTNAGARLFAQRLSAPSNQLEEIASRHHAVDYLLQRDGLRASLVEILREAPDLVRALSRLSLNRGGPRDLAAIGKGLALAAAVEDIFNDPAQGVAGLQGDGELSAARSLLQGSEETYWLSEELEGALQDELPALARDGGFIKPGYSPPLDECRALRDDSRRVLAELELRYRDISGIASLKVKHNNVLGYFIEVTAANAEKMMSAPLSETFQHRQTLAGATRFTTPELNDLAAKIEAAGVRAVELEGELFKGLTGRVLQQADEIYEVSEGLALLDVNRALAQLAIEERYVRPQMTTGLEFRVSAGRHPVVEQTRRRQGESAFIANNSQLDGDYSGGKLWLVTGPNMAGKSTFLRQNALIAIMAQTGSFVPADQAEIGLVDRVFSRVGASDDLARGRSTFMVEMVETAAILNLATERSLVILDEIGRGTATYDGLAIAWATLEYLHNVVRARGLFATHYHELTALSSKLSRLHPVTMQVKEWRGEVRFLHEVVPGTADRSYGVQVAKLAGLPGQVIRRASAILKELEDTGAGHGALTQIDDLPLFGDPGSDEPASESTGPVQTKAEELCAKLSDLDVDALSPRDALAALYELKAQAQDA